MLFVVPDFTTYGAWGKVSKTVTDLVLVVVRLSSFNVWVLIATGLPPCTLMSLQGVTVTPSLCVFSVFIGV